MSFVFKSSLRALILVLLVPLYSSAQLMLVQYSDAHSTIKNIARQIEAMDQKAQSFLEQNPQGEVVVMVLGDFTSINPYSAEEAGYKSFEALKILKDQGYTVLFVPGNHDAFDWTAKIDGAQLFLDQMRLLKSWGIPVLASNLKGVTPDLAVTLQADYRPYAIDKDRDFKIIGLTLENLMEKSNLNEETASPLFKETESYTDFYHRFLAQQKGELVLAIHQAHEEVSKFASFVYEQEEKKRAQLKALSGRGRTDGDNRFSLPLLMAAHDHEVASYKNRESLIADAGSHGSFNLIYFDRSGNLMEGDKGIEHVSMGPNRFSYTDLSRFTIGQAGINPVRRIKQIKNPKIKDYAVKMQSYVRKRKRRLKRVLFRTLGFENHKSEMKKRRTRLGSLLADAQRNWAKDKIKDQGLNSHQAILSWQNSSSYRMEEPLQPGEVTEFQTREMYPFLDEAVLVELKGAEIEKMFFALRRHYDKGKGKYTPQMDSWQREKEGRLEVLVGENSWMPLEPHQNYYLVLDGWLGAHIYGQSFRVSEMLEVLRGKKPLASDSFQEILVEYIGPTHKESGYELLSPLKAKAKQAIHKETSTSKPLSCSALL